MSRVVAGAAVWLQAFFTAARQGKTGLTPTVDVFEWRSGGPVKVVADGAALPIGGGLYGYAHTLGDTAMVSAVFKSTDATVDLQHVPATVSPLSASEATPIPGSVGELMGKVPEIKTRTDALPDTPASKMDVDAATAAANSAKLSADEAARPEDVQVTVNPTPVEITTEQVNVTTLDPSTLAGEVADTLREEHGAGAWGPEPVEGLVQWTYRLGVDHDGDGAPDANADGSLADPIVDAFVYATAVPNSAAAILDSGRTNGRGEVILTLPAGTVYIWRSRGGYRFENPDVEVVS